MLRIVDVEASKAKLTVKLDPELSQGVVFDQIIWVNETRLVVQAGMHEIFAVDVDGKNHRRLVNWEESFWHQESEVVAVRVVRRNVRLVGWSADDPDFVHFEASWIGRFAVVRVHHGTGKAELSWEGTGDEPVLYDRSGAARVRTVSRAKPEGYEVRARAGKSTPWVPLDRALGTEKQPEFLVTVANAHGPRSLPLGFGRDPEVLYIASNMGRDTFGIYAVDLRTKRRTEFALEHPVLDLAPPFLSRFGESLLVRERKSGEVVGARFSRQQMGSIWADPELSAVQQRIERLMPDEGVRIVNWDDARERFLVRLSRRADPGVFAVYTSSSGKLVGYLDRAPQMAGLGQVRATTWFMKRADGTPLTGYLTMPPGSRRASQPVVVVMRAGIWGPQGTDDSPVVRALAQMGYAVLEVAHRGTLGQGLSHWEAGRGRHHEVMAEDIFAALERVPAEVGLDRSKVALYGSGYAATMALKLAVLRPERVACVVADGPFGDVYQSVRDTRVGYASSARIREVQRGYFGPSDEQLKAWSPTTFASRVTRPVMVVTTKRTYTSSIPDPTSDVIKKLRETKQPMVVLELATEKGWSDRNARASEATEKFLAEHLPLPP
ncbi:MAG: prolyl oligopeptidase family serine peptidase [Opitutaceae bacterium]|nr:prolyl oligopeptidase family serine peptidase [Opitutaceae bacterium]